MTSPEDSAHTHPRHRLDPVIHAPLRFSIMATLAAATRVEFGFVRDTVEVSDSVLSKQVATLEGAGYVTVSKGYVGKRPRTWLSLTPEGRAAFRDHVAVLASIVGDLSTAGGVQPS
jgi:DNA-binding MarR family transcriptional regulator